MGLGAEGILRAEVLRALKGSGSRGSRAFKG